ncbi:MerR family DNA-binding transcriptional regulator [Streptomyces bambusae]|uniref:MerR family DNA-binding transcriptional regulator n=1 Tax=Streptomyces bambusae TaxID=1550616 RepID=A0ABS6Z271_9ACTN|nr:MerR family DNA-binding transcriptional regulator [Streptomyces bambusae]
MLDPPPAGGSKVVLVNDRTELLPTGELARRTGLSVRTIRFWSDSGVVEPTSRSRAGPDVRLRAAADPGGGECRRTIDHGGVRRHRSGPSGCA